MAETFKKALQPPHPSEKQAGKAISPPPCQHGVPVYPLRYGVTDEPLDSKLFPKLSTAGYPTLQGGKAYGMRVLRPGCYVYLCYMKDGRMWTQHYQVTKDVRFARIWWTEADDKDAAPGRLAKPDEAGAQPWLLAPDEKVANTVYLLVSDTVLTHRTLYRIETNEGGLRDKLTTQVKPAGGAQQSHTFQAFLVGSATVELVEPAFFGTPYGYSWSEVKLDNFVANSNRIISGMYAALKPCKDVIPLAVALQDTIGIASELGYLCSTAVKERDAYQARNKHKLQSAALIDTYFKQIDAAQDTKTPDDYKAIQKKKDLVDLRGVRAFRPAYDNKLKALEPPIKHTGADVVYPPENPRSSECSRFRRDFSTVGEMV
ncbi:toxin VasX, partial [Caballeronia sp. INSB1]|uniref:toxin VasX n=1 Tax=Caballeronia sp. INSB1 TaxID=2921751 RepID=UPI002032B6A7